LKGNSDGSGAVQIGGSDAISISTGLNTTFAGTVTATGTVAGSTGTLYPLTSGTAVASTSGTAIDFTGIPSWAKRITVMFNGVSTNGTSNVQIQLGTSGGIQTTGYAGTFGYIGATTGIFNLTTGFGSYNDAAADVRSGSLAISLLDGSTGLWVCSGLLGWTNRGFVLPTSGAKTLSGTLDRVRITTVNGTDAFDAGSINILFE
jgi:hypothetical protein